MPEPGQAAPLAPQVEIRTRLLSLAPAAARRLLPELGAQGAAGAHLAGEGLAANLQLLVGAGNATEVGAPAVLVRDGERAAVTILHQLSYIEGFRLERTDAALLVEPEVGVLENGMLLDLRPRVAPDGSVDLDLALELRALQRPLEIIEVSPIEAAQPLHMQVPVYFRQELHTRVQVPDGGSIVLGPLTEPKGDGVLVLFLSARVPQPPVGDGD